MALDIFVKKHGQKIIALMLVSIFLYGFSRVYYTLTGGFLVSHIKSKESFSLLKPLESQPPEFLNQPFHYLGKGIQSYVFLSEDGKYVIKFIKMQRFQTPFYLDFLSFIPSVEASLKKKALSKQEKLKKLLESWMIAYEDLPKETGVLYLHFAGQESIPIELIDKMGFHHHIKTDDVFFLVQYASLPIFKYVQEKMEIGEKQKCIALMRDLVSMFLSEYKKGINDSDPTLMQNTGVYQGMPIHIDVGDFVKDEKYKNPIVYEEELFNKTYRFRLWLQSNYPELALELSNQLYAVMGERLKTLKPTLLIIEEGD